jgi:hypothetical protein
MTMMKPRASRIDLTHDLPLRPRALSPDALSKVFGGCIPLGQTCSPTVATCCYGACQLYKPYPNWPGKWICDVLSSGGE